VDRAIVNIRVIVTDPWVKITLLAIQERRRVEIFSRASGDKKRARDSSGGGEESPGPMKLQSGGFQGICYTDCTTQDEGRIVGCSRQECIFEHVRDKRELTVEEKRVVKGMIATRNKTITAGIERGETGVFLLEEISTVLDDDDDA
jgi:hypothetical protein